MTDETTGTVTEEEPTAPVPAVPGAVEPVAAEVLPFWQRPNVERYLLPLVLPIVVVVALVVYVLNLSRVFLSAHGNIAVSVGSVITVLILVGATLLSNSSRLRSSSIALMTTLFLFVVFSSGWLVLGHSQEKGGGTEPLAAAGPAPAGKIAITAAPGGKFTFAPLNFTVKTGVYSVTLTDGATGQHTLDFDDPATLFAGLQVGTEGEKATSRIFFGAPGEFTFYCAITGHRASGMAGTITVTGPPMTLEQAQGPPK